MKKFFWYGTAALVFGLTSMACSASEDVNTIEAKEETSESENNSESSVEMALDVSLFADGALTADPNLIDCTLSDGSSSQCYQIVAAGNPASYEVGPFCPTTTDADASEAGIWLDGQNLYDVDGQFILDLAEIYGDDNWKLYNDDGSVNVTETAEEFDLAARPNVDESLVNHCVEGKFEWLEGGEAIPYEAMLPVNPALAGETSNPAVLGVTVNGVRIDGSAPVDAILGAYTIAAFDDCGGHFNPAEGYHMHAAVDCDSPTIEGGDAGLFGFASDGFPILLQLENDSDLDACGGHDSEEIGYHYHASAPEDNAIIKCLSGLTLEGATSGGPGGGGPGGDRPDR